jgi:hypothetical protein
MVAGFSYSAVARAVRVADILHWKASATERLIQRLDFSLLEILSDNCN